MEELENYRYIVNKKVKNMVFDSLKKTISSFDMTNFGFIGIFGSHKTEYSHDIDILIFPSKEAKIGRFIISVSRFYNALEGNIKNYSERFFISTSPRKILQEMTYYISSLEEGGAGLIPIHSLVFVDKKSFEKFNPSDFKKEIKKSMITLYGNFNIINELDNSISQEKLEPYFLILDFELFSKLKTFPRHLVRVKAESLFNYLRSKYSIKALKNSPHNLKEIEKEICRILLDLDKQNYS